MEHPQSIPVVNAQTFICETCSEPFTRLAWEVRRAATLGHRVRFCSNPCRTASDYLLANFAKSPSQLRSGPEFKVERLCQRCGRVDLVRPSEAAAVQPGGQKKGIYCSARCRDAANAERNLAPLMVNCTTCGRPVRRTRATALTHVFCSRACMAAMVPTWSTQTCYRSGVRPELGHYVRSTWEANVCRILRFLHIPYEYEPRIFDLGDTTYRPDIWAGYWIEVKGWARPDAFAKIDAFRRLYPNEVLVVLDTPLYHALTREFAERIPGWEYPIDRRRQAQRMAGDECGRQ